MSFLTFPYRPINKKITIITQATLFVQATGLGLYPAVFVSVLKPGKDGGVESAASFGKRNSKPNISGSNIHVLFGTNVQILRSINTRSNCQVPRKTSIPPENSMQQCLDWQLFCVAIWGELVKDLKYGAFHD